jgi:short-subunit dehydrogenase
MLFTIGLRDELANTNVRVQLVLPASTDTEIWDVAGIGVHNRDPATVMSVEDCVDAALAGLDKGETVTLPSVEDANLWAGSHQNVPGIADRQERIRLRHW